MIGLVLLLISAVLGVIAASQLGNSWRVGVIEEQKTELVQKGIYQFCRNPFFLSYFIMFFGLFLVAPSVVMLLAVSINIFFFHRMVKKEETYLQKNHGMDYQDYCQRVGRYLPNFSK